MTGQPVVLWDGANDRGAGLSNGVYLVTVRHSSTSAAAGPELLASVTLASERPPVRAAVYDAAGVLAAEIPAAAWPGVARIRADPPVFAPDLAGSARVAFRLTDTAGALLAVLSWNGQDGRGHVVPNGSYLFAYAVRAGDGTEISFTEPFTIAHGPLDLVTEAVLVPNPVPASAGRVWMRYRVKMSGITELRIRAYTVAGELVVTTDATAQGAPADPLDADGDGYGACRWDLRTRQGSSIARGLYLVVLEAARADGFRQRVPLKLLIQ